MRLVKCWWLISLYFLFFAECDYPIPTWWASVFVRLLKRKSYFQSQQNNSATNTFQSDDILIQLGSSTTNSFTVKALFSQQPIQTKICLTVQISVRGKCLTKCFLIFSTCMTIITKHTHVHLSSSSRITHTWCYSSCVHRMAAECQEYAEATVGNVLHPLAPACLYQWNRSNTVKQVGGAFYMTKNWIITQEFSPATIIQNMWSRSAFAEYLSFCPVFLLLCRFMSF